MYADDDLQKLRCCSSSLQNNHSAEAFPHALNSEGALTFYFSHQQNIPFPKCPPFSSFLFSFFHLLYSNHSQHLSLLGSFPFSTEIPSISMENTLPIISLALTRPAHSLQFLACFTTKNPYGFMVGCKEPKPRPKMGPQHFPKPIWSLWG